MAVATGVTAGSPGSFTGGDDPADKTELDTISGTTAWTAGQYVTVNGNQYHWDGHAWATGKVPAAGGGGAMPKPASGRLPDNSTGVVPYWGSTAAESQKATDDGAAAGIAAITADEDADPST